MHSVASDTFPFEDSCHTGSLTHTQRQNLFITLEPIWFPHWPACRWTISLILRPFLNTAFLLLACRLTAEIAYVPLWLEAADWERGGCTPPSTATDFTVHIGPYQRYNCCRHAKFTTQRLRLNYYIPVPYARDPGSKRRPGGWLYLPAFSWFSSDSSDKGQDSPSNYTTNTSFQVLGR